MSDRPVTRPHCQLIQAGDIQAIVGDASRDGVGGPQYCGLWSLTSRHCAFNAFGNSYAGLIPGELRGKAPALRILDAHTCELHRDADDAYPVTATARYRIEAPNRIEHVLTFRDHQPMIRPGMQVREVSWCCYMNAPEDPRLHFRSGGGWTSYLSPEHGQASRLAPSYVPDAALETLPQVNDRPFHWDWAPVRFDEPFYFGRVGPMALILVFGEPAWLRFFCSPSGGNPCLVPGRSCPAWDFLWAIPAEAYVPERGYTLAMRMIYKPFVSHDDVLAEVAAARGALDGVEAAGEPGETSR